MLICTYPQLPCVFFDALGKFDSDGWVFRVNAHSHEIMYCYMKGIQRIAQHTDTFKNKMSVQLHNELISLNVENAVYAATTSGSWLRARAKQVLKTRMAVNHFYPHIRDGTPQNWVINLPFFDVEDENNIFERVNKYISTHIGTIQFIRDDEFFAALLVFSLGQNVFERANDLLINVFSNVPIHYENLQVSNFLVHLHLVVIKRDFNFRALLDEKDLVYVPDLIQSSLQLFTGWGGNLRRYFQVKKQVYNEYGSSAQLVEHEESSIVLENKELQVGTFENLKVSSSLSLVKIDDEAFYSLGHGVMLMRRLKFRTCWRGRLNVRPKNFLSTYLGGDVSVS